MQKSRSVMSLEQSESFNHWPIMVTTSIVAQRKLMGLSWQGSITFDPVCSCVHLALCCLEDHVHNSHSRTIQIQAATSDLATRVRVDSRRCVLTLAHCDAKRDILSHRTFGSSSWLLQRNSSPRYYWHFPNRANTYCTTTLAQPVSQM